MLVTIVLAAVLWLLGVWMVLTVVRAIMRRLRVDRTTALLWLGLAEEPMVPRSARPRLEELL